MIYMQTDKARQILAGSSSGGGAMQKIRTLLMLLDGKTTTEEIQALFGSKDISSLLKSLVPLGLIVCTSRVDTPTLSSPAISPKPVVKNDGLDRFRDAQNLEPSNISAFDSTLSPVSSANDEAAFKRDHGEHLSALQDLLLTSDDPGAFDLMFSLERCCSVSQLKLLVPHIGKITSKSSAAETQVKKIWASIS